MEKGEEIQALDQRVNREEAEIEQLKDDPGTDNKAEIKRKEQLVKNLKEESKIKQKERAELEKKTETHRPT